MIQEKILDLEEKIYDLESQLESKRQESQDLADIASVITSILDIESVLAVTMEVSIRRLGGEVGAILLLEDGDLTIPVSWGVDSSTLKKLIYKDNIDVAQYCFRQQVSILENNGSEFFPGELSISRFIACPILSEKTPIGVVVIFNKENGQDFDDQDRLNLEMICKFASVAIENSALLKERLEKQKIEQELELAREVQTTLLPNGVKIRGLNVATNYIPARQVSGDYYDLIPISDRKLFFLLGDVTSKGVPAALVMTAVYSIVRAYATPGQDIDVRKVISHLNDLLCNDIIKDRDMFITLFMAYIDLDKGMMEYCNGGHPPVYYYRAASGDFIHLKPGGPLVGQFAGLSYQTTRVKVGKGDRLFCYTDGVIEAENHRGELYGLARLEEFFKAGIMLDTERFSDVIKEEINRYSQGAAEESTDDITTLVIDFVNDNHDMSCYEFTYPSKLENLAKMYADLSEVLNRHGVSEKIMREMQVAVSEAFTNAVVHAHGGDEEKKIGLSIELNKYSIAADIVDEGSDHDIDAIKSVRLNRDSSAISGRGMGIIRRLSDQLEIRKLENGGVGVRIIRYLKKDKST